MKTNAYHYNEAVRDLERYKAISLDEARTSIEEQAEIKDAYSEAIDLSHEYNSGAASAFIALLELEESQPAQRIAEGYVYNSRRVARAKKRLELYAKMYTDGYMPIHDITPDMNGKPALLSGTQSYDWMTTHKEDEKVKLVALADGRKGYARPKMRSRFFGVSVDSDMFIKLI